MPLCSFSVSCLSLGPRLSGGPPASLWVLSPSLSSFYPQRPAQYPAHSRYSHLTVERPASPGISSHSADSEAPPGATSCRAELVVMAGSHQLTWAKHVYVEFSQLCSHDAPDQLPPPTHTSFSDVYRELGACGAPTTVSHPTVLTGRSLHLRCPGSRTRSWLERDVGRTHSPSKTRLLPLHSQKKKSDFHYLHSTFPISPQWAHLTRGAHFCLKGNLRHPEQE